jgi:hypothetical protein
MPTDPHSREEFPPLSEIHWCDGDMKDYPYRDGTLGCVVISIDQYETLRRAHVFTKRLLEDDDITDQSIDFWAVGYIHAMKKLGEVMEVDRKLTVARDRIEELEAVAAKLRQSSTDTSYAQHDDGRASAEAARAAEGDKP